MASFGKVSLIVPVYKHPDWVKCAVESALKQSYPDLEILLIDDGSPDGCDRLCDDFAAIDPRVRVLHKKNGGVSSARNLGLENADGDYIAFLDSDDRMEPDHIESLVSLMEETNCDIASLSMIFYESEEKPFPYEDSDETILLTPEQAISSMHLEGKFNGYLMNKLYRKEVLAGVWFDPEIAIHEDMLFLWDALLSSKTVSCRKKHSYHYLLHDSSAMNAIFSLRYETALTAAEKMVKNMKKYFPHHLHIAQKTLLFAVLSVANKRAWASCLDKASYQKLKNLLKDHHSASAQGLIVGTDNQISYRLLRRSRALFLLWKRIVALIKNGKG